MKVACEKEFVVERIAWQLEYLKLAYQLDGMVVEVDVIVFSKLSRVRSSHFLNLNFGLVLRYYGKDLSSWMRNELKEYS